jgi:hypothetical protein
MPQQTLPAITIPQRRPRHTYSAALFGVVILVWLSTEDTTMILTSLLGLGISFGVIGMALMHRVGGRPIAPQYWIPAAVGLGALAGPSTVFTTFMLMLFKNVQHSHITPDFPVETMGDIWLRVPAWTVAGALLGGAWALARIATHRPSPETEMEAAE